jgi:hypothetical protein
MYTGATMRTEKMITARILQRFSVIQNVVLTLFVMLGLIQVLDAHSTLTASAGRFETNSAINWLAGKVGFTAAVLTTKSFSGVVIFFMYRVWCKTNGAYDRVFVFFLALIAMFYSFIVFNNYIH